MTLPKRTVCIALMPDWMNKLEFMRDTNGNDVNLMH